MALPIVNDKPLETEHLRRLSRLLPLWPHELADPSLEGRQRRVALLRRALRAERRRGLAGEWTYDLARHVALRACYQAEVAELNALTARDRAGSSTR